MFIFTASLSSGTRYFLDRDRIKLIFRFFYVTCRIWLDCAYIGTSQYLYFDVVFIKTSTYLLQKLLSCFSLQTKTTLLVMSTDVKEGQYCESISFVCVNMFIAFELAFDYSFTIS